MLEQFAIISTSGTKPSSQVNVIMAPSVVVEKFLMRPLLGGCGSPQSAKNE